MYKNMGGGGGKGNDILYGKCPVVSRRVQSHMGAGTIYCIFHQVYYNDMRTQCSILQISETLYTKRN